MDWAWGLLLLKSNRGDPGLTTASVAFTDSEILPEYADYAGLFDKEAADVLPAHQEWDHCIPLENGKSLPYGSKYELTPIEIEALQKKIDMNLEQEFIQLSTLTAGAPILFVKKKDGGLRLCVDY